MTRQDEASTKQEIEKVIFINRTSKVVKGGRKFRFSALVLYGDGEGRIGLGFAKANEVSDAIRKASESARKSTIAVKLEGTTIPHPIDVKSDGVRLIIRPAKEGSGVIAGSNVRSVLEAAGIKDVMAKSLGSNCPINQVRAVFQGLSQLKTKDEIQQLRGTVS